jgi:hypothetical protein
MSGLDLYQTQRALALLFVYAAVLGVALGGVYDTLLLLRVICGDETDQKARESGKPLSVIFGFTLDLLFSVLTAIALILLCYYANDGQLRAPAVFGMAGGFFVYRQTLGRVTVKIAKPLRELLMRSMKRVLRLILWPLAWVATPLRSMWQGSIGRIRRRRWEKQTEKTTKALIASARQGFGVCDDSNDKTKKK